MHLYYFYNFFPSHTDWYKQKSRFISYRINFKSAPGAHSEPGRKSKMKVFEDWIFNGWKPWAIFGKSSILYIGLVSEYAYERATEETFLLVNKCVYQGVRNVRFFGKFDLLCFLVTSVLRFALLPYYRQITYHQLETPHMHIGSCQLNWLTISCHWSLSLPLERGFLFSGGIERDQWPKMGQLILC